MDATDQLLLSEGVCHQLGMLNYHPKVEVWRGGRNRKGPRRSKVPTVHVRLINSVRVLPQQSAIVPVQVETPTAKSVLFEPFPSKKDSSLDACQLEAALIHPDDQGHAQLIVSNPTECVRKLERGTSLGRASDVVLVAAPPRAPIDVKRVICNEQQSTREEKFQSILSQAEMSVSPHEREKLIKLLLTNHQAFALEEGERGETDLLQFTIDTGDAAPKKQSARRMPFAVRQEVNRQLKQMMEQGVIQASSSPWASPIVLVKKKDGTLRFCVDYRALNFVTKSDTFPLPRIDDLLDQLGKAKYFTTLDLAAGYWQILVHPDAREKTAFITHRGLYEFRVMPFGLTNAPAAFQRLMQLVLTDLNPEDGEEFVNVYIDDVIVFSASLDDHLNHLQRVLNRISEVGLKLKPAKCHFAKEEVQYLGYLVTREGLRPTEDHLKAVSEFPVPKNIKEVRQFLGLASYYRRFINGFARIAHPLHQLTRKDVPFAWTAECQAALDALKTSLVTAPVLAYPNFSEDFVLETDASIQGLGAVLSQKKQDGKLHPVAYGSRSLTTAERNYSITELETLAVVWAVTHYKAYLYGHNVTIYTDHSAVKAILETPSPSGKHARWWLKVYSGGLLSVQIIHRSGKSNTNADALSRSPCDSTVSAQGGLHIDTHVAAVTTATQPDVETSTVDGLLTQPIGGESDTANSFGEQQREDPALAEMIDYFDKGQLPNDEGHARKIVLQAPLFTFLDGTLFFVDQKDQMRKRVVVPEQLKHRIMEECHGGRLGGHFSGNRLHRALAKRWWWQGMYSDTLQFCKNCLQCTAATSQRSSFHPPLQPIPVERTFQIIGVDLMELPRTSKGNQYVLVFQDFLSKFPLVFPVPDQKTERIVKILVEQVIPLFGVPEALLSDCGANLLSHLMKEVCEMMGIKKLNTTSYHPQCDGMVERFNRTLKTMLRKHAAKFGVQWDKYLYGVLWAYRNTPHESTGEKPSFLLFGMDCRTPTEAAFLPPTKTSSLPIGNFKAELMSILSESRQLARDAIKKSQDRYKKYYDQTSKPISLQVGDHVFVKFPQHETGRYRKLSCPWFGPYRLMSLEGPDAIVSNMYYPQDDALRIHLSRVKPSPPLPIGSFWYGAERSSNGRVPRWMTSLERSLEDKPASRYPLRNLPQAPQSRDEPSHGGE